jgi:predicted hydrocarbon binding protein
MGLSETRDELQGLLVVMASLSHGLEQVLGRGAETVTFRAGKNRGAQEQRHPAGKRHAGRARQGGRGAQGQRHRVAVRAWKPAAEKSFIYEKDGKQAVKLVFRNCMVRCALFRYGHEQKQSLCMMNHGLFCGYVQKITGKRAELDICTPGKTPVSKSSSARARRRSHGQGNGFV